MKSLPTIAGALALATACAQPLWGACPAGSECTCGPLAHERLSRQPTWVILETDSFRVSSEGAEHSARHVARHAETLRAELAQKWLGARQAPWHPKCQIVLHASRGSYTSAVGRGSESTIGSSAVTVAGGAVTARRIDLLSQGDSPAAALPHELTHVMLQERFAKSTIPRWADEGLAILADDVAKQGRHRLDLQTALARRATIDLAALLTSDDYPAADRWGAFYGQSASLTDMLVSRGTPQRFLDFLERALSAGYDRALFECYGIRSVAELERLWRGELQGGGLL